LRLYQQCAERWDHAKELNSLLRVAWSHECTRFCSPLFIFETESLNLWNNLNHHKIISFEKTKRALSSTWREGSHWSWNRRNERGRWWRDRWVFLYGMNYYETQMKKPNGNCLRNKNKMKKLHCLFVSKCK